MGEFNYAIFVPEGVQNNDIWDIVLVGCAQKSTLNNLNNGDN